MHFGFRLMNSSDIHAAMQEVENAGGRSSSAVSSPPASHSCSPPIQMATRLKSGMNCQRQWILPDAATLSTEATRDRRR
jgi:hypothetical protein